MCLTCRWLSTPHWEKVVERDERGMVRSMAAAQMWTASLTGSDRAEQIPGIRISANMTHLLGVEPLLGRPFLSEEERVGNSQSLLSFVRPVEKTVRRRSGIACRLRVRVFTQHFPRQAIG